MSKIVISSPILMEFKLEIGWTLTIVVDYVQAIDTQENLEKFLCSGFNH